MITLILGGSGSGKSAWAEQFVCDHFPGYKKIYLATMETFGAEAARRIERHRALRKGKDFETLECSRQIGELAGKLSRENTVILLECMSNLVANEMFVPDEIGACKMRTSEEVAESVMRDVACLEQAAAHMVIVSNNVFEDGVNYDASTKEYIRALGAVNLFLAKQAEKVVEVVVGIPVSWKGAL